MKKRFNEEYEVVKADNFNELRIDEKLPYPFEKELLNLLKKENRFKQEYYYIKKNKDFAFFTVYKNKMNMFTFGKVKFFINLDVIGFPCSLSNSGYVTNNEEMLFDYIAKMPGAKLILNVDRNNISNKYTVGNTLPTCIIKINFKDIDEYLSLQRSSYRRRIKMAIKFCEDLKVIEDVDSQFDVHNLYLNTYQKSNYKLEKLEKGFFDDIDATKIVFIDVGQPVRFCFVKKG